MNYRLLLFISLLLTLAIMSPNLKADFHAANKRAYENLQATVDTLSDSLANIAKERNYQDRVISILSDARQLQRDANELLAQGHSEMALTKLQQAALGIKTAIASLLNGETIVYRLVFDGPEDECQYEIRRTKGLLMLAETFYRNGSKNLKSNSRFLEAQEQWRGAQQLADNGNFDTAMLVLGNANRSVSLLLSDAGVWIPL